MQEEHEVVQSGAGGGNDCAVHLHSVIVYWCPDFTSALLQT